MRLKVIFLGYLRELTQMDQTFSKQLLDPDPISQDTLLSYVSKINKAMNSALKALRWEEYLSNENENIEDEETLPEDLPLQDTELQNNETRVDINTLIDESSL